MLGRDPLAQLLQPQGSARLLVPAEELETARQLLDSVPQGRETSGPAAAGGLESALATVCGLAILIVACLSPISVPFVIGAVAVAALVARWMRRRRRPEED